MQHKILAKRYSKPPCLHYVDVIMTTVASQITSLAVVYSIATSGADERNHQSSASLAFVPPHKGQWPVNCPHKWSVPRKTFPFDDVIVCHFDVLSGACIDNRVTRGRGVARQRPRGPGLNLKVQKRINELIRNSRFTWNTMLWYQTFVFTITHKSPDRKFIIFYIFISTHSFMIFCQ